MDLVLQVGAYAGPAAALGLLLLAPLYLSQRRDVRRLRAWAEHEPERGEQPAPAPVAAGPPPEAAGPTPGPVTAAQRVAQERPAPTRITTEEAAVAARGGWRRFLVLGPRHPLVIAAAALLAGVVVFLGTLELLGDLGGEEGTGGGLDRSEVEVTVLNATSTAGLADKVADDLSVNEFEIVGTDIADDARSRTTVLFEPGNRREAQAVARTIGVKQRHVDRIERPERAAADGAAVVVIAGEDRARP